jgi:hypothetical protein
MVVTPFGDLIFGDNNGLKPWLAAHDQRHKTELQGIGMRGVTLPYSSLDEKINDDWLGRHLLYHLSMVRFATPDQTASSQLLEMKWDNPTNFQVWHQMHNNLHQSLDQQLGISSSTSSVL